MKCIIIDSDSTARQLLAKHISQVPFLELVSSCNDVYSALKVYGEVHIDLIILETRLTDVSGLEFIKSLDVKPLFIFATSHDNYAVEAFELCAVDYIMKPMLFSRFLKAANRAANIYRNLPGPGNDSLSAVTTVQHDFILVKSEYKSVKVQLDQILYIEGLRDYVKIFMQGGEKVVTLNSLKKMSDNLPADRFLRVHKSFIVNTTKIASVTKNRIIIGSEWIPVGDSYKADFQQSVINKFAL